MKDPVPFTLTCSICKKPVDLKTSKTDDEGKAVHEDCYSLKLKKALEGKPAT